MTDRVQGVFDEAAELALLNPDSRQTGLYVPETVVAQIDISGDATTVIGAGNGDILGAGSGDILGNQP